MISEAIETISAEDSVEADENNETRFNATEAAEDIPTVDFEQALKNLYKMKDYLESIDYKSESLEDDLKAIPLGELQKVIHLMNSLKHPENSTQQLSVDKESDTSLVALMESMPHAIELVTNVLLSARNILDNVDDEAHLVQIPISPLQLSNIPQFNPVSIQVPCEILYRLNQCSLFHYFLAISIQWRGRAYEGGLRSRRRCS